VEEAWHRQVSLSVITRDVETNKLRDIIDTTPYDGNVYKMLLGSFDSSWDDEPSSVTDNM
jgi:hypothetical protein